MAHRFVSVRAHSTRCAAVAVAALSLALGLCLLGSSPVAAAPSLLFEDVTSASSLHTEARRSWGSILLDYDRDGLADVFLNRHARPPSLHRNEGGRFGPSVVGAFFTGKMDRHGCAWGEANGDGRPDLYCTQGANKGKGRGPNQLLLQSATGFVNRAGRLGVQDAFGRGRTVNWIDFDTDGDLDLFVGNKHRAGHLNATFENVGHGFSRVSIGLSMDLRTVSSSWSDWDGDGDPDLLVLQYAPHRAFAYENRGGRFAPVRIPLVSRRRWISGAWGDFDADGRTDLQVVNERRSLILRNTGNSFRPVHRMTLAQGRTSEWLDVDNDGDLDSFVVQGAPSDQLGRSSATNRPDFFLLNNGGRFTSLTDSSWAGALGGNGDAASAADFNRDGRIDLHTTNGYGPEGWTGPGQLLRNRSDAGNWIGLHLEGSNRNPLGMGARVVVRTDSGTLRREITDGVHHRVQSEVGYVHFGLGNQDAARVRIEWPGGRRDCAVVDAGRIVRIEPGSSPCARGRLH